MKKWRLSIPLLYMLVIFGLSSIPYYGYQNSPKIFYLIPPDIQNLLHIPEFGFLAYLWMTILQNYKTAGLYSLVISIGYSFLDEFHQYFIPGRYASLNDIIFDTLGIIFGIIVYKLFR